MLLVISFRKHITSRGLWPLCAGPETQVQWKSESVNDGPTFYLLTGVGSIFNPKKYIANFPLQCDSFWIAI